MKPLRALLPWLSALPVALLVSGHAAAADIKPHYRVYVGEGDARALVGTWILDLDQSLPRVCRYSVKWAGQPRDLPALYLDEQKTAGRLSCAINSQGHFVTALSLAPDLPALWEDGARRQGITAMTLVEDDAGELQGTVELRAGGTYVVTATP